MTEILHIKPLRITLLSLVFCLGYSGSSDSQRMVIDTSRAQMTDTTASTRPLPQWLIDQKKRATARETIPKDVIRKDDSMLISLAITGITLILIVITASIVIIKRKKN